MPSGEKGFRQEQNRRRQDKKKIRKTTLLIGKSLLICGVHFQMRSRQYTRVMFCT
jgi:hypothetical protein